MPTDDASTTWSKSTPRRSTRSSTSSRLPKWDSSVSIPGLGRDLLGQRAVGEHRQATHPGQRLVVSMSHRRVRPACPSRSPRWPDVWRPDVAHRPGGRTRTRRRVAGAPGRAARSPRRPCPRSSSRRTRPGIRTGREPLRKTATPAAKAGCCGIAVDVTEDQVVQATHEAETRRTSGCAAVPHDPVAEVLVVDRARIPADR